MIGTKARISFLPYMSKKCKTFEVKLWAFYEAPSRYCLFFQLYKGKFDTGQEHGLAYRVVMDLMDGYTNKNHHLYVDNFYTFRMLIWKQSLPSVVVQLEWIVDSFRNNSKLQNLEKEKT